MEDKKHINDSIFTWAKTQLNNAGIEQKGEFETIRDTPWAEVYRLNTSAGPLYLKQPAEDFDIEAHLVDALSKHFNEGTPQLLAAEPDTGCMLLADSGTPLRDQFNVELVIQALSIYAEIQIDLSAQTDALESLGLPDFMTADFRELFELFLTETDYLKACGLSDIEYQKLISYSEKLSQICEEIGQYKVPCCSIDHSDFHDNNILIQEGEITIIDWGESVVTHPFFSLYSCLFSLNKQHGIAEGSADYVRIRNAYLAHWVKFENKERLLSLFNLVGKIQALKHAFSLYRCVLADEANQMEDKFQNKIADCLRVFIDQMSSDSSS